MKFHVHAATTIGIVWVPRYKWVSGKKTDTNYRAATKAVAFADTYMNVNALALVPYDWETCTQTPGNYDTSGLSMTLETTLQWTPWQPL